MCSEVKKSRGAQEGSEVPWDHTCCFILYSPSHRAQLNTSSLQVLERERGILFQTKLSYNKLSETEKCPSVANSPDISPFCVFPHIRTKELYDFLFTEWTRERQRNPIWKGQNTTDVKCSFWHFQQRRNVSTCLKSKPFHLICWKVLVWVMSPFGFVFSQQHVVLWEP